MAGQLELPKLQSNCGKQNYTSNDEAGHGAQPAIQANLAAKEATAQLGEQYMHDRREQQRDTI